MSDDKLDNLRHLNAPPPNEKAKEHALNAAMEAFEEKNAKKSQGSSLVGRLTHRANQLWESMMKKQLMVGTALASVLAVMVVVNMPIDELGADGVSGKPKAPPSFSQQHLALHGRPQAGIDSANEATEVSPPMIAEDFAEPPAVTAAAPLMQKPSAKRAQAEAFAGSVGNAARSSVVDGMAVSSIPEPGMRPLPKEGRDRFESVEDNPVKQVSAEPVSTFSVDVDTSAYSFTRRALNNGVLPQKDAVRVEELINYFDYDYPVPDSKEQPFKPTTALYQTPWNQNTKLLHIGIKGHEMVAVEKPSSNLVFLLDVSGSMSSPDKLPLLKNAFRMMVENLDADDTVSIVTYAGSVGTVLEPTKVAEKGKIIAALDNLHSGGSTAGAQGIKQAYALAEANYAEDGVNRVILATDGDFNVGITNRDELKSYIERKRDSGIFLSVLGFGQGNYNDALMQTLAQNGNGNAAYIDSLNEARKVLVEEASSTLYPIAKDVKIQIEFNPAYVSEYRLIGYETRMLKREDFNNDKVDAGDIGSGHTVTAIYELTPAGSETRMVDDLRYQDEDVKQPAAAQGEKNGEYAFLKLRYKLPEESKSRLISQAITQGDMLESVQQADQEVRFAAAVAAFGQLLKGGTYTGDYSFDDVIELAQSAKGSDPFGYRAEFINLVRLAKTARAM